MKQYLKRNTRPLFLLVIILTSILNIPKTACAAEPLQLTLPKEIYALPGIETGIYFDNIVLAEKSANYRFEVKCKLGKTNPRHWKYTPTKKDVGQHQLTVTVKNRKGIVQGTQSTKIIVVPANAGQEQKIRLMIIGDSLTNASVYPNEIARLLSLPGNPDWQMLGSHKSGGTARNVVHEGYGGWTWEQFVTRYVAVKQTQRKRGSSPFVFLSSEGNPALNIPKYFEVHCNGKRPDFITILLGVNDCFTVPYKDKARLDAAIEKMLSHSDVLITALRLAAPEAEIGICLTTPGNSRDESFEHDYKGRYSRWGWKVIQHNIVQRQLKQIAEKKDPKLSIIPTELYLDTIDGYPDDNSVHPNKLGYHQISSTIYAWLKWKLASTAQ